MTSVAFQSTESPLGAMTMACTRDALVGLTWSDGSQLRHDLKRWGYELHETPNPMTRRVQKQLREYFSRKRKTFDVPLTFHGTEFQNTVWKTLSGIPFGTCLSYRELAYEAGYPDASRAVGTTMKNNQIPIFVPCHRVIRSDGGIGGYNGGLHLKTFLLNHEGIAR